MYDELEKEKDLIVIHLKRENTLEQFLSESSAWHKKEWTKSQTPEVPGKLKLDLQAFQAYVERQKKQEQQCLEDFSHLNCLTITYEGLLSDPSATLEEVQEFLGVPQRSLFTVLEKQASYALSELLVNVAEVKEKYPEYII